MTSLIFLLFFSFCGQGLIFDPDDSARRIQTALLGELQKQESPAKYSEIDSLLQTLSALRLSCKIEIRDHKGPKSCLQMVKWKEDLLNHSATSERKELESLKRENQRKDSILKYIESRKKGSFGTLNE